MSDMQRARKIDSSPSHARDGSGWSAPPVAHSVADDDSFAEHTRPNPFSSTSGRSGVKKMLSFEELSRRDDNETKNFSVPPELIALARANRAGRGHAGTLTPLAPKPTDEVVVVVPPAPAPLLMASFVASVSDEPPSVPERALEAAEPPSPAQGERSSAEESGPREIQASRRAPSPSHRYELAPSLPAAAPAAELEASPSSAVTPGSAGRSALRTYAPFLSATLVVGAYVALCYVANALLASLP
jgi:hypothetical protein